MTVMTKGHLGLVRTFRKKSQVSMTKCMYMYIS